MRNPGQRPVLVFGILSCVPLTDNIALGITDVTYASLWALTSVATNVSVTSLIAYRLITARRRIATLNPGRDISAFTGVVAILIESAFPLSVLGIAYAVNLANTKPRNSPEVGKEAASYILSSLYFAFLVRRSLTHRLSELQLNNITTVTFTTNDHISRHDRKIMG